MFLAIPMKRQMVNQEQLKFPSGIAAAETLRSLYSKGAEAMKKAYALLIALVAGGLVGLLRTYGTLVEQLRATRPARRCGWRNCKRVLFIPEAINFPHWLNPMPRGQMTGSGVRAERAADRRGHDYGPARVAVHAAGIGAALLCRRAAVCWSWT